MFGLLFIVALFLQSVAAFRPITTSTSRKMTPLKIFDGVELGTTEYIAIAIATVIPSLAFVKFIGDQADSSRGQMTDNQKNKFQKAMMETPGLNIGVPTSEEETLKRQIKQAYMQDKDVDVAVLEEKLKQRIQWRREIEAQGKTGATEDDDGW